MPSDEQSLRAAMRDWLAACDALDAAAGEDYAETLQLAETASLARLRLHGELVARGWKPPQNAASREGSHTA